MRLSLLFIFVCITLAANAQYDFLLHKTYAERCQSLDTLFNAVSPEVENDTTTFFNNIYILRKLAQEAGDEELVLESVYAERRLRIVKKACDDGQNEQVLYNLLKKSKEKNIHHLEIIAHDGLAYVFNANREYGKFFKHLADCYDLLQEIPDEKFPKKKSFIMQIAMHYYFYDDIEAAEKYFKQALNAPIYYHGEIDDINILNTLGLIKRNSGKYDSALYYFERSLALAQKKDHMRNKFWVDIVSGNIGITYYLQRDYEQAKPLLRSDIETSLARNEPRGAVNPMIKLSDVYLRDNNLDSARYFAREAVSTFKPFWADYKYLTPLRKLLSAYKLLSKIEYADGNIQLAHKYADTALEVNEKFIKQKDRTERLRARVKVEQQLYQAELARLEADKKVSVQNRNTLIMVLLFLMVLSILLLSRQNILRKKIAAEKDLTDNQLKNAERRLKVFIKTVQEKNKLLEDSAEEINRLRQSKADEELPVEVLQQLQTSTILTDEEWDEFKALFEQVHSGYLYRLRMKQHELTPAEERFIVLNKLRFNNKEIANTLGVSAATCRNYKSRLVKKLDLSSGEDFYNFIDKI